MPASRQKPGVYPRPGSSQLQLRYYDERGKLVRRSAETENAVEAWGKLKAAMDQVEELKLLGGLKAPIDQGLGLFMTRWATKLAPGSEVRYTTSFDHWIEFCDSHNITDFTQVGKKTVGRFVEWRKVRGVMKPRRVEGKTVMVRLDVSEATIRRDIAFLSSVWSYLLDHPEWEDHMPPWPVTRGMKRRLKEADERVRFATPQEWKALIDACKTQQQRDILTMAVETGLREQNLARLTWSQVDLERRQILIIPVGRRHMVRTKNMKPLMVPLTDEAVSVLSRTPRSEETPYVFWQINRRFDITKRKEAGGPKPGRFVSFANWWQSARKRSGVQDYRYHDIRHTFASRFLNRGGDLTVLQKIMGHKSIKQTEKYAHMLTQTLHSAVRNLSDN